MTTPTMTISYETPLGTFQTWEEAAAACERADFDPCECITVRRTTNGAAR